MSNRVDVSQAFQTTSDEKVNIALGRLKAGCGSFLRLVLLGRGASHLVIDRIDAAFAVNALGVPKVQSVSQDGHLGDANENVSFVIEPTLFTLCMVVQGIKSEPVSWSVSGFLMIAP